MKKQLLSIGFLAGLAATPAAFGQSGIQLGQPIFGGTGCPADSASATITPDGSTLSILFDEYVAEAGGVTRRRIDRKSCNVSIPVRVPQGFSVSVFKVDYRGFNALPRGAQSQFNVEYFFAGSQGPRYTSTFNGPVDDDYLIRNNLIASAVVWSPCGQNVILRANSSMRVTTNTRMDQALSTVDSADVEAGLIYHLQWRRCTR